MYRKSGLVTLIVFVFSFFLYPFIAAADTPYDAFNEFIKVDNSSKAMGRAVTNYDTIKGAMETLNGAFDGNEKKVAQGKELVVSGTGAVIISVATTAMTGGSYAPAAFAATLIAKLAGETAEESVKSQKLVDAMGTVSGLLSGALSDVNTAYSTYNSRYSDYIGKMVSHSLIRFTSNNTPTSVYTAGQLDYAVNTSGVDSGYYHSSASSPSDFDHAVSQKQTYKHWRIQPVSSTYDWNMVDLKEKYKCKGSCSVMFTSPYDAWNSHRQKCGPPETQPVSRLADYTTRMAILGAREWQQGCGEDWYSCDSNAATQDEGHKVRTCAKTYTNSNGRSSTCDAKYRNCMGLKRDHNESDSVSLKSYHSETADSSSPIVSPPPTPTPTDGTPNCPDCTSHCAPPCLCSNSGTCNGTVSYHVCGEHETTVSGDHSLQASCSLTDANGNSCTVTNFYACQSHTCVFPAPPPPPPTVSCGRSGCSASVSSANEHRVGPCTACGGSYWSCSWSASYWANEHRLRTCRYGTCGQTWRRCQSSTPNCLSPNRQGERCWAADP